MRFGCPRILMSDQGSHFVNQKVNSLYEELKIQHKKSTPYHPQECGTVEAFNKILETVLTKVCNVKRNKWDVDFVGPINLPGKRTGTHYIITATDYLTRG